ncbi:MAG: Cof-type HAD-IIB family hydrolase [Clostridium sp.]|uniref:Cof-type HAD-IIB family hydrolase n=1 Tax=Clostridium sp. TaxID=1506 RepID=UPI003F2F9115
MKKLLASDLDGTLVFENKMPKENMESVKKLNESGQVFIVSTGRPLNGVDILEEEFNIGIDYYVLLNGALILDKDKKTVLHKKIERKTVEEILDKYIKEDMNVSVETGYTTYVLGKGGNLPYPEQKIVNGIEDVNDEISLISIYIPNRKIVEIDEIKEMINSSYDEVVAYRNSNYIDVVPKGCSKGNGVMHVAKELSIEKDNIYTIGDSWNDVTMFKMTKNSFTFHEVEESLKENANHIVKSVSECIEEYILA